MIKKKRTGNHNMDKSILYRLVSELVLLLCISVLAEIFVFNIRTFTTAGYNEQVIDDSYVVQLSGGTLTEDGLIVMDYDADSVCIDISGFGYPLRNIVLDVECVDEAQISDLNDGVCYVEVMPFDDAMFEEVDKSGASKMINGAATCVAGEIIHDIKESHYIYLKSYGNTHGLEILLYPSSDNVCGFRIYSISFNTSRPMDINPVRVLLVFLGLVIVYFSLINTILWKADCVVLKKWKLVVIAFLFCLFSIATIFLALSNRNIVTDAVSPYAELAQALCAGKMDVGEAPVVISDNEGTPVFWHIDSDNVKLDYALFEGRYYVCFGMLPCIMFYVPYYLITGGNLPNSVPYVVLRIMVAALVGLLLWIVIKKYYRKTPFAMFTLMWGAIIGGMYLPVMLTTEVDHCDIPIFSGVVLVLLGTIIVLGSEGDDKKIKIWSILLCSICFAAVSLCRPIMLLYGGAILGVIIKNRYDQIKNIKGRRLLKAVMAIVVPFISFVAICMVYNVLRFGSPFDFGLSHIITIHPLKGSSIFLPYVIFRTVYDYFLKPPIIEFGYPSARFPAPSQINEAGCIITSSVFAGGILALNPFVGALLFQGRYREKIKRRGLNSIIPTLLLVAILVMIIESLYTGSISTRYTLEFSPAILFSACLMLMEIQEDVLELNNDQIKRLVWICIAILLLISIFWGAAQLFCYSDGEMTVITGNPKLWYGVMYMFRVAR